MTELKKSKNTLLNIFLFILFLLIIFIGYTIYLKYSVKPAVDTIDNVNPTGNIIQVEVLNGTEVKGLAEKVTNYLRSKNVDVVYQGNYKRNDIQQSFLIDRIGNDAAAKKISKLLGINPNNIKTDLKEDFFLDVTIIIGNDYSKLKIEN